MLAIGERLEADGQPTLEVAAIDNGSYICRDVEFGPNLIFRAAELEAKYGVGEAEIVETNELEHWERFRHAFEKYRTAAAPDEDAEEADEAAPELPPSPNEFFGDSVDAAPQEPIVQESRQFV